MDLQKKSKFFTTKNKNSKKKLEKEKFVELIAKKYCNSVVGFIKNDFPYFLHIYKNDKKFRNEINSQFEIDKQVLFNF